MFVLPFLAGFGKRVCLNRSRWRIRANQRPCRHSFLPPWHGGWLGGHFASGARHFISFHFTPFHSIRRDPDPNQRPAGRGQGRRKEKKEKQKQNKRRPPVTRECSCRAEEKHNRVSKESIHSSKSKGHKEEGKAKNTKTKERSHKRNTQAQ